MKPLANKVAIVTASSRGIGFEITKEFVNAGAKVYMAVRKSDKNINLTNKLHHENVNYCRVIYDALDFSSYKPMVEEVVKKESHVDILVNNFGTTDIMHDKTLVDGDSNDFFRILKDNVGSVYYACKNVVEAMIKQKNGGSIINISSVAGVIPDISRLAYSTSKAAINSLTKNIATQYARNNIRCNAIMPGLVKTDGSMENMSETFLKTFISHVPLNRIAQPADIAKVAVFLASEQSGFITGELLPVAGGFGMPTPIYSDVINGKSSRS